MPAFCGSQKPIADDRARFQKVRRRVGQARADEADLAAQPGFVDGAADAEHIITRRGLEALDIRVLAQDFLGLFIGAVGIVEGFVVRVDERHVGMLLGVRFAGADPLHMCAAAERADECRPLALVTHALGQAFVECGSVIGIVEGFDVRLRVLLVVGLMGHDDDAAIHRALQRAFEHGGVHRHDGESVDALGDQILNNLQLLGRIGGGRTALGRDDIRIGLLVGLDARVHAVEPRNAADLDDGRDHRLLLCHQRAGGGAKQGRSGNAANQNALR